MGVFLWYAERYFWYAKAGWLYGYIYIRLIVKYIPTFRKSTGTEQLEMIVCQVNDKALMRYIQGFCKQINGGIDRLNGVIEAVLSFEQQQQIQLKPQIRACHLTDL